MVGMKHNLKETLEIRDNASDPKVKLQAAAIANDCYKFILDMTTNAGIVSDALKYVTQKTEQVNKLQKLDERIEADRSNGRPRRNYHWDILKVSEKKIETELYYSRCCIFAIRDT
jgi:hypothetical protein